MFASTLFRACQAQKIAAEHYESGNQAKQSSLAAVYSARNGYQLPHILRLS